MGGSTATPATETSGVGPPGITCHIDNLDLLSIPRPSTPTGTSTNPIWISSLSPCKKRESKGAKTHVSKTKKRCRPLSPVAILPAPTCRRKAQNPGPWPVTVVTDSSEEESLATMLQDLTDAVKTPSISSSRPPCGRHIRHTPASTSPRYTSPPDDMFLSNTPPAGDSTFSAPLFAAYASASASASVPQCDPSPLEDIVSYSSCGCRPRTCRTRHTPASVPICDASPDDMFLPNTPPAEDGISIGLAPAPATACQHEPSPSDDMFLSDSSEELPLSIIPPLSTPNARTLHTPFSLDAPQGSSHYQAVASTSNIDNSSQFLSPHTPQKAPLPSPFAHLSSSEFDLFILKSLPKKHPK